MRLLSRDDSGNRRQAHKAVSPPISDVDQFPSDYDTWRQPAANDEEVNVNPSRDRVLSVHPGMVDVEAPPWQAPLPDDVNTPRDDDAPFVPLDAVIRGPVEAAATTWSPANAESDARPASDPDAPFIPLGAGQLYHHHHTSRRLLLAAAIATLLAIAVWIVAEVQYVNGNAWGRWDEVWYAAGAITIAAGVGWLVYGYRWYQHRRNML